MFLPFLHLFAAWFHGDSLERTHGQAPFCLSHLKFYIVSLSFLDFCIRHRLLAHKGSMEINTASLDVLMHGETFRNAGSKFFRTKNV